MNAAVLVSVEPPCAADTRLHLVKDQQKTPPVADLAQAAQERPRNDPHSALALDRLDHDRPGLRADRRLDRVQVGQGNLVEAIDLGAEPVEYLAWPPAAIIASVRPWNAPSKVSVR